MSLLHALYALVCCSLALLLLGAGLAALLLEQLQNQTIACARESEYNIG